MSNSVYGPYHEAYLRMCAARNVADYHASSVYPLLDHSSAFSRHNLLINILIRHHPNWKSRSIHPAVAAALYEFGTPHDWHLLALECPGIASDNVRVSYIRNEAKRKAYFEDRELKHLTVTSVGKYLTRHWPKVRDEKIRNLAARFTSRFEIIEDLGDMIEAVEDNAADSCMKWSDENEINSVGAHPYSVYDPKYGWKLAVVVDGQDSLVGRALLLDDGKRKGFVRTYGRDVSDGMTQSHAGLHSWLESQGYEYWDEWPEGCKFAKIQHAGAYDHVAPYLDPGPQRIRSSNSRRVTDRGEYLVRSNYGEYTWDNTDGSPSQEDSEECSCCGGYFHTDRMRSVGYSELDQVCDSCAEDEYTWVQGRNRRYYYLQNDRVVTLDNGDSYDVSYLSDNDIVELHNGDYAEIDDTVYVESESEYYRCEDVADSPNDGGDVVRVEPAGEYVLYHDAEWCEHNKHWVLSSEAVEVAGGKFVYADDLDDYLLDLPRDEVENNCVDCDAAEKLAMWDEHNQDNTTQLSLVDLPEPAIT